VKRVFILLIFDTLCLIMIFTISFLARAQPAPIQSDGEPGIEAKIAQLETAKRGLEREARETNGYHED
jgi:hypothetical protein